MKTQQTKPCMYNKRSQKEVCWTARLCMDSTRPLARKLRDSTFFFFFFFFFPFLWPYLQHREVPRLGVELETQNTGCDLYHSSQQGWVLSPLKEARDQPCILLDTSHACNLLGHNRNSLRDSTSDATLLSRSGSV